MKNRIAGTTDRESFEILNDEFQLLCDKVMQITMKECRSLTWEEANELVRMRSKYVILKNQITEK